MPILQVDDPINATVRGSAFLAFISMGYRTLEELPGLIKIKRVYEPNQSSRAVYDKMYTQYRQLFNRNKTVFKALNHK